jgi:hypothetical protein
MERQQQQAGMQACRQQAGTRARSQAGTHTTLPCLRLPAAGSIRACRPEECPHGALGRYLAQRFTIECEPFPSVASSSDDYYTTPLWRGQVPTRSISYDELASSLKSALRDLEIIIRKVTHAMRVAGARRMDQAGVDDQVIACMGTCLYEAMYRSYLLFFKPEGLMAAGRPVP